MNVTINKIKYNELKKFFQLEKKICLRNFAKSYRSVMSCTLATKTADLFVLITNPLLRSYGSYSLRKPAFLLAPRRWRRFAR